MWRKHKIATKQSKEKKQLAKMIDYIGRDKFVKFTNAAEFPELSDGLKKLLSETGIYNYSRGHIYPVVDGILRKTATDFIQFGINNEQTLFVIDISDGEKIKAISVDGTLHGVNTSLYKYTRCLYQLLYYSNEIESKNRLGDYWKNHKKYARKLESLLLKTESSIKLLHIWYVHVYDRYFRVL
jgi:hypothetical protein